jgi:OOP family OmpA-OmpF porin
MVERVAKINACSRVVPLTQFLDNPHYLSGALFSIKTTSYTRLRPVTQVVGFIAEDMLFDFDSTAVRSEYAEKLGILGRFLQRNPNAFVVVGGYADNVGDYEYNLALSEHRAEDVKKHLVDQFSINPYRIVTLWFGEDFPVADNGTAEGRQRNRRVQIAVGGVE